MTSILLIYTEYNFCPILNRGAFSSHQNISMFARLNTSCIIITVLTILLLCSLYLNVNQADVSVTKEKMLRIVEEMASQKRKEEFDRIFAKNEWGSKESVSGLGSEMAYTENIRHLLGNVISKFEIKRLIDSPCGDANWQWSIPGLSNIEYLGLGTFLF